MGDLAAILLTAAVATLAAAALWIAADRLLRRRSLGRWRAAPLGLTLSLAALGYGVFWLAFFTSPTLAVQAHSLRLVLDHVLGDALPWCAAGWLAFSALPLLPLARR